MSFANMLVDLCERIPGGDVDVVTDALGADRRIGRRYLTGALGYGGPCFPRDNVALGFLARELGADAALATTTHEMNCRVAQKAAADALALTPRGATVAVLGLAYKPASHVIDESQGVTIARVLAQAGLRVVAYDPLAGQGAREALKDQVVVLDALAEALREADAVLVTTPDPLFAKLAPEDFRPGTLVVDHWRALSPEVREAPTLRYVAAGHGRDDEAASARLAALWSDAGAP
jgi:UDPglucose 6-dehydrogenase